MIWANVYSMTGTALAAQALTMWTPRSQEASVTMPRTEPAP